MYSLQRLQAGIECVGQFQRVLHLSIDQIEPRDQVLEAVASGKAQAIAADLASSPTNSD